MLVIIEWRSVFDILSVILEWHIISDIVLRHIYMPYAYMRIVFSIVVCCKLLYFTVFRKEVLCVIYACKVDFVTLDFD